MSKRKSGWTPLQIAVHVGAFIPLLLIAWDFWQGSAAVAINPFQAFTLRTGKAAIILLMLSLAVTPLITVTGWRQLAPLRKPLGLYAFMYAAIHFTIFVVDNGYVENSVDWMAVYEATFAKRFALVGFATLLILLPMPITSNKWSMRHLKKNWKRLHRLVYVAGILAAIHFIWLVKSDYREPLIYAGIIILLLVLRIPPIRRHIVNFRTRRKNSPAAAA